LGVVAQIPTKGVAPLPFIQLVSNGVRLVWFFERHVFAKLPFQFITLPTEPQYGCFSVFSLFFGHGFPKNMHVSGLAVKILQVVCDVWPE